MGGAWTDTEFAFGRPDGNRLYPQHVSDQFLWPAYLAGLPGWAAADPAPRPPPWRGLADAGSLPHRATPAADLSRLAQGPARAQP